jgi:hypothetical protein
MITQRDVWLVSIQEWSFSTILASICGVPCSAYNVYVSAQPIDFFYLEENYSFLLRKLLCAHEIVNGWALAGQIAH